MEQTGVKVNEIIYNSLKHKISYEDISGEKRLVADLGAESIELIDIFYSISAEFNIELNISEVNTLKNISDIYQYVQERYKGTE